MMYSKFTGRAMTFLQRSVLDRELMKTLQRTTPPFPTVPKKRQIADKSFLPAINFTLTVKPGARGDKESVALVLPCFFIIFA